MVLGSGTGASPPPAPVPGVNVTSPWAEVVPEFEVEGASKSEPVGSEKLADPALPNPTMPLGTGLNDA